MSTCASCGRPGHHRERFCGGCGATKPDSSPSGSGTGDRLVVTLDDGPDTPGGFGPIGAPPSVAPPSRASPPPPLPPLALRPLPGGAPPADPPPVAEHTDWSESSLAQDAAIVAGGWLAGVAAWLAPVVVIGGLGLVLFEVGSRTTEQTFGPDTTEVSSLGLLGIALVAVAAALLFGRGTAEAIARVARGEGGFFDALFAGQSVIALLIAAAAWLVAILAVTSALGIGPLSPDY